MKVLINLGAQRPSDPARLGYHLENRIIFYLVRMISAQKQTEFFHSDYDNLKKVYSIWICLCNREDGDSMLEKLFSGVSVEKKKWHTDRGIWDDNDNRTGREDADYV